MPKFFWKGRCSEQLLAGSCWGLKTEQHSMIQWAISCWQQIAAICSDRCGQYITKSRDPVKSINVGGKATLIIP